MGEIRENLVLTDQFSASFSKFLDLGNNMTAQWKRIETSIQTNRESCKLCVCIWIRADGSEIDAD